MAPDARAKKILFNHYWTSAGWRGEPSPTTTKEDIQYAKACGVMFDPVVVTHSETWKRLLRVVRSLSRQDVAAGFVASLSNRRVERRSALGTWSIFQHASAHARAAGLHERCEVCGQIEGEELTDLSILSFERLKWGGVRHLDPSYALLDLEPEIGSSSTPIAGSRTVITST